jgi:hypothetical protein
MIFARRVVLFAGALGLLALLPMYLLEGRRGRDQPPAIAHPEFFYGFLGVSVAWQVAFLVISRDPARFGPLIIPTVLEKAGYGLAALAHYARGRTSGQMLVSGLIDLALGVLFVIAFVKTRRAPPLVLEQTRDEPPPEPGPGMR